jgi:hypothetical protein
MKLNPKRQMLIVGGFALALVGSYNPLVRQQPAALSTAPSPATLRFRGAIRDATEVRLYKAVGETSTPNWEFAEFALNGVRPFLRLRGDELNGFVQSLQVDHWRFNNGAQVGAAFTSYAAEFYRGSKRVASLRIMPGRARWYGQTRHLGDASLTEKSWRDLQRQLGD